MEGSEQCAATGSDDEMGVVEVLQRYWATVRGLHPEQIRHQVLRRLPLPSPPEPPILSQGPIPERVGWGTEGPRCSGPIDPGVLQGRFAFWGVERVLDLRRRWEAPDLGLPWNYPVHYFDAAPPLARNAIQTGDRERVQEICTWIDHWIDAHPVATSVGWDAYPTALRIVNWLDVVQAFDTACDPAWRERVLRSIYVQAGWLEPRLERHLLGTHLMKDVKALVFAGTVFATADGARWRRVGERIVRREIDRQVLADGGHLEPSVQYHGLALDDLLDLVNMRGIDPDLQETIVPAAAMMVTYLAAVLPPDGRYPLLGDAERDGTPSGVELLKYASRLGLPVPGPSQGLHLFADSGVASYRAARHFLLADVGPIGAYVPGHGHCDSLSFEWWVDTVPLVVDSGTRTYERGAERTASRETRAHNTIVLDGREQHEIWAAYRVGRRSAVRATLDHGAIEAELVPWYDTRLRLTRRFEPDAETVRIRDRLEGEGEHRIESWLHLHPECEARRDGRHLHVQRGSTRARITILGPEFELLDAGTSGSVCCESFGVPRPNAAVRIEYRGAPPWTCEIRLEIVSDRVSPG